MEKLNNEKYEKQSEKSEGRFDFLLPCLLYNSPLILFPPYFSLPYSYTFNILFNLEYFRSDKTFQTRGSIRACILKPMYTNCIIKRYDIKKYFNEIGTTSLHTHIRAYVPRCALGIHVCTYIKDHDTSLPIQFNTTSRTIKQQFTRS